MEKKFNIKTLCDSSSEIGEIVSVGCYNGAYLQHYRVTERVDAHTVKIVPVKPVTIRHEGNLFSTEWVDVQ